MGQSTGSDVAALVAAEEFSPYRWHASLGWDVRAHVAARTVERLTSDDGCVLVRSPDSDVVGVATWGRHEFETELLGVPSHRLGTPFTPTEHRADHVTSLGRAALSEPDARGGVVIARVDADDVAALGGLQRAGFGVYEAATLWVTEPNPSLPEQELPGYRIEVLDREDCVDLPPAAIEEVVDEAGRCFRRSHFHADPCIAPDRADALYRRWACNTFAEGWAEQVVTVWEDKVIVGFLGFSVSQAIGENASARILTDSFGLVLARASSGVGTAMYQTAIRCFAADLLEFGTQLRSPLMRVFARGGHFRVFASYYTLHGWAAT